MQLTYSDVMGEMDSALAFFRRKIRQIDSRYQQDIFVMENRYDALDAMRKHLRSKEFHDKVMMDRVRKNHVQGGLLE